MRSLIYFLLVFCPLAFLLWFAQADTPDATSIPDTGSPGSDALIDARDLGAGDVAARVIQLEGVQLRLLHEDEVRCYARLGKLVRHEGEPRVLDVLIAIFEKKKLKMTIESPFANGEPGQFLARKGGRRVIRFGGGVTVRDAQAREIARVPNAELDVESLVLRSDDRITMRMVDRNIEVSGTGFSADLKKKERMARIFADVVVTAPAGQDSVRMRCAGPATLEELLPSGDVMVTLTNAVVIEHPLAGATCNSIVAVVRNDKSGRALRTATLSGKVVIDMGAENPGGLESVRAPQVVIVGDEQILLRDFTAVRKGSLPGLGPDERTLDIAAGSGALTLLRDGDKKVRIWEISLNGGVTARDRNGSAVLTARTLLVNDATGAVEATGGVSAKTPEGLLEARSLFANKVGDKGYDLRIEGPDKRIEYVVDGKLGPLGKGRRGRLVVRAAGPITAAVRETTALLRARARVSVSLGGGSQLTCGDLALLIHDKKPEWIEARRGVRLAERDRGAELVGDSLVYRDKFALVRGFPARVRADGRGAVRARVISYRDGGDFSARDEVVVAAQLDRGDGAQLWDIRCDSARGRLVEKKRPEFVEAIGHVVAQGPQGQHFSGNYLRYDSKPGTATLRGEPAVVQRGKELRLRSAQIDLKFTGKELVAMSTPWPSDVEVQPAQAAKAGGRSIVRWHLKLPSASFRGDRLTSPRGGSFEAFDAAGKKQVSGRVGRAVVFLKAVEGRWEPVRMQCTKRVTAKSHGKRPANVTADRLDFAVGSKQVELVGHARVKAKGWSPEATFDRLIFVLTKDGVDLKRASGVTVQDPRR